MKTNRNLAILTIVLCVISVISYRSSITQAERFERGQKFLPNLNPDKIAQIHVTKGNDQLVLKRQDDHFKLASKSGYPAKNQAVNRLITQILDVEMDQEIGTSEAIAKELETTEGFETSAHIVFKDDAGKDMVDFYIGKNAEDGQGSYVRKAGEDQMAYLTSKSLFLTTTPSSFLEDKILDVNEADVARIEGADIRVEEKDGALELVGVPSGKETKSTEFGQVKGLLSNLTLKDAFLADDPEVQALNYTSRFNVYLKDKTHYQVLAAKKDERMFIKIEAGHSLKQIQLTGQESEEEMKEKSKVLQRADEQQKFNEFHGSWVYELNEYGGKKFFYTKKDLIQDKAS